TGGDEIPRDCGEVLERAVPVLPKCRLVPGRTVLAAAADVGEHVGAAALEPRPAEDAGVVGGERDLEAAVPVQERRSGCVGSSVPAPDHEIRNTSAVVGR